MLLRPTHSRVIMPASITGRDSTARYSAVRGRVARGALWRKADPASSRPMLCEQKSPITVPNVPEMNMQTQ